MIVAGTCLQLHHKIKNQFQHIKEIAPSNIVAQGERTPPDSTIDASTRKQVIDIVLKRLNDSYVFPEVAQAMEKSIRDRVAKGEYDQISSSRAFAETLTKDLQAVSKDKHLRVRYSHEVLPERQPRAEPTAEQREQERRDMSGMNYGFEKVERLRARSAVSSVPRWALTQWPRQ